MGGILSLVFFGFGTESRSIYARIARRLGYARCLGRHLPEKFARDITPIRLEATRSAVVAAECNSI
jgi:hypothetical protein